MNERIFAWLLAAVTATIIVLWLVPATRALTSPPAVSGAKAVPVLADARVAVPMPKGPVDYRAQSLRLAHDYRSALLHLRTGLDPDDPLLRSLLEDVRLACAVVRRPDAAQARVEHDPNRRPWLDQLQRRCSGITAEDLDTLDWTVESLRRWEALLPGSVEQRLGPFAAQAQAVELMRVSVDPRLIAEALRWKLQHDLLPTAQIFPGRAAPPRADLESAILPAADWIACQRTDTCGSEGLWTLYTCAQHGCRPGSDLPTALQRLLPRMQYEHAAALARWLQMRPP